MESLRRLTSSVFDTGLVLRGSQGEVRAPDARSLNLTFMTERLVVVGAPCDTPTDKKRNLVNADDLAQYLETHHRNHYMFFSLNSLDDVDDNGRQLVADKLHEQLLEFNWERDGMKAHTPPLDLIFRICYALNAWLSLDPLHVALISCQTGKTRCGVVVACYLLFAKLADNPTIAFVEFYRKRWDMMSLTPHALKKKTPPSIQRFLTSFHALLQQKPSNDRPLLLKAVIFRQLPVELQPCVQIWDDYKLVFCSRELQGEEKREAPVLDWNEEDGFFAILWENGIELDSGFTIVCSFGDDYGDAVDVDASSKVLFRYADSTLFLFPGIVTLKKRDLDLMKQYEHGFDEDQFSVDLVLRESSAQMSRNFFRKDFSGNSATWQGLVEITKHHVVLPDPAMHSNFVRMGFSETSTTFALQRSQNAPNVALDLLHSKGMSTICAQAAAEIVANKEQVTGSNSGKEDLLSEIDQQPALHRQTTAEVNTMQSKRLQYTALTLSLCDTCKEDDFMMRSQLVKCAGQCGKYYHTTCVGLRKIPFGLTTTSDRTNHAVYVKKFFSAWECDVCFPKSPNPEKAFIAVRDIPSNMKLVPADWIGQDPANSQDITNASCAKDVHSTITACDSSTHSMEEESDSADPKKLCQLKNFLATSGLSLKDLINAVRSSDIRSATAVSEKDKVVPAAASESLKLEVRSAAQNDLEAANELNIASNRSLIRSEDTKYNLMLKRGVPFEGVQNCMRMDGVDPSNLQPIFPIVDSASDDCNVEKEVNNVKIQLKDMEVYARYFRMLRMGCPKEAVEQKLIMDGVDPIILELGPTSIYEEVKGRIAIKRYEANLENGIKSAHLPESRNKNTAIDNVSSGDRDLHVQYDKVSKLGIPDGAADQNMKVNGEGGRALDQDNSAFSCKLPKSEIGKKAATSLNHVKLKDDPKYAKFFKMLQMGLPEGAVRQKMKAESIDERALDIGGNGLVSELLRFATSVKLQDDPIYSKYFKMLKMGLPDGAVRQKMMTEHVDVRALELGPDAFVSQLSSCKNFDASTVPVVPKVRHARKKLHWQAISEDRLSNLNQQTIWEDEDDDVSFDMDMDELEALFFANQSSVSVKKNSARGQTKALKRKQAVTLIDGKRAMNAAISLARIKLSYVEIADAVARFDQSGLTNEQLIGISEFLPTSEEVALVCGYTGNKDMLGEAEKFIIEIAKVRRYAQRMECLVYKLSFASRSTELATSVAHLRKAAEEAKSSRLLKTLLAMVLKLGNTLNGSGEDDGIKGFTVDSLLRLGHTKAINKKTTVLHYLVRLAKKNHPQILDFQAELRSVPLAARESFEAVDGEFKKLQMGLKGLETEVDLLEKQAVEDQNLKVTIRAMQTAASEIESQIHALANGVTEAREEVSNVLNYFGEDSKRNPTDFFTTLASFCSIFQQARNEVDTADEAERSKVRRSSSLKPATKVTAEATAKESRPILERTDKRYSNDS
ncbi:formin-homology 2 domain-containing protein [Plasmopara halstedii]|uniref:Formin-homology 2 domain-containing protein n=1 Tax=Plasmopara halstedii TaxID=4781 RepID=A0A0P1A795_PLAHL|nr:formin-homology 2 domain-containing protein [Plasmopara halstedii]CEG36489.1 formin-homology 2 domain-containing protein [Plasmopara halstedii]|eukprot:XP_024572858.1 formin-homology 2 domain-containing protein [Plasmopara halstedii]